MIGLDTNLIVRLLTNDDKKQAKLVANLIENNSVFIPKSVLLETEWVLRYTYDLSSATILKAFENLLGLVQVTVEDTVCVKQALHWYSKNLDFADALHLASSNTVIEQFATFDKAFIKKAKQLNVSMLTL